MQGPLEAPARIAPCGRLATARSPAREYPRYRPKPLAGRPMIAVELLTAHPGNVRRDIDLDAAFHASIEEMGILTPLRLVIEGHRLLAAAVQLGLIGVPTTWLRNEAVTTRGSTWRCTTPTTTARR
jgi:hypothetical protein